MYTTAGFGSMMMLRSLSYAFETKLVPKVRYNDTVNMSDDTVLVGIELQSIGREKNLIETYDIQVDRNPNVE